jgi:hypothetical protein
MVTSYKGLLLLIMSSRVRLGGTVRLSLRPQPHEGTSPSPPHSTVIIMKKGEVAVPPWKREVE